MGVREKIVGYCRQLLGETDQERDALLNEVCGMAMAQMLSRLRPDIELDAIVSTFIVACALLAMSVMKQLEDSSLGDFTAATVKLTFANNCSELSETAYRLIEPWCADGFVFRGVRA